MSTPLVPMDSHALEARSSSHLHIIMSSTCLRVQTHTNDQSPIQSLLIPRPCEVMGATKQATAPIGAVTAIGVTADIVTVCMGWW